MLEAIDSLPDEEREVFEPGAGAGPDPRRKRPRSWASRQDGAAATQPLAVAAGERAGSPPSRREGRPAMTDDPRVERLLEELLESGGTPEEVCRSCPELLPQVRAGLQRLRRLEHEIDAIFPSSEPPGGSGPAALADRGVAEDPRLRGASGAGARRHGRRVPGAAPAARPPRRPEDAPGRPLRRPGGAGAVPARGGGGGGPSPRKYRSDLRRRRPGRPAVLHHGIRRRWQPRSEDRRHAATGTPVRRAGGDDGGGHPCCAPERHRPPRPEAGQHPARRRRHAQGHRLRPGPPAGGTAAG